VSYSKIVLSLAAGLLVASVAAATLPAAAVIHPEWAYVVYPEASHVVYPDGILVFGDR
jgi:hypothetical protein